ncbi:hypothetical protein OIDMADRAFT_100893 [Oidiodendron maius Zn]|uniref:Uncharacterized protein n=1 Tax=Oidiodendron maius (strain Zn) TaxID=913774 RepID=A0A0C3D472_OIDMZ|nr:hypothetical protein OIDMADRAFT_100893 [Oidiodendron maius Zn]
MYSPPRREKGWEDDSHLPKGNCRYILLHPEVKGLRCACVGFALNRALPGSTCDCGHQACYHVPEKETSVNRREFEVLEEKISRLEDKFDRESRGGTTDIVGRLGRLEETVETAKAETDADFKNAYRGMGGLWRSVESIQKRMPHYDDQIDSLVDEAQRMASRLVEIDDASMQLEDRVEALENVSNLIASVSSRRRKASTPPSIAADSASSDQVTATGNSPPVRLVRAGMPLLSLTEEPAHVQSFRKRVASVGSGAQSWTVHISLLPSSSQPFPFEKDTAAYKRCLSRGLHRITAIPDTDSDSFKTALDESLMGHDYNYHFLQANCAVTDESGKIIDLYIAMTNDTISWVELKEVKPFLCGLEASWIYDPFLDGPCVDDGEGQGHDAGVQEKRPAAGDILTSWSPSAAGLKRKEAEISRTPSFSSSDDESPRGKIRRPCTGANIEVVGRQAEAV